MAAIGVIGVLVSTASVGDARRRGSSRPQDANDARHAGHAPTSRRSVRGLGAHAATAVGLRRLPTWRSGDLPGDRQPAHASCADDDPDLRRGGDARRTTAIRSLDQRLRRSPHRRSPGGPGTCDAEDVRRAARSCSTTLRDANAEVDRRSTTRRRPGSRRPRSVGSGTLAASSLLAAPRGDGHAPVLTAADAPRLLGEPLDACLEQVVAAVSATRTARRGPRSAGPRRSGRSPPPLNELAEANVRGPGRRGRHARTSCEELDTRQGPSFVSNVSHELRTPLTTHQRATSSCSRDEFDGQMPSPHDRDARRRAAATSTGSRALINDLLDALPGRGPTPPSSSRSTSSTVVGDVVDRRPAHRPRAAASR